ncbi:MAG: LysR family transcriptional regulator [Lachnospiraceae bacterium]|nr:LysR family transcriptional regulator [Lachnospiraceae bacterium]
MNINMEYFKIFYYVAKMGSITAAAKELHISQPAVSQGLKNFEEALGGEVFIRNSKGVTLTEEGKSLYFHVAAGMKQIENGVRQYEALKNLTGGNIRIGASDMTLRFFILPYLEVFCESYPQIKVSVTNAPTPKTVQNLEQGLIDFGVVSTPVNVGKHIKVIKVKTIQDIFVVGKKYRELSQGVQDYGVLEEYSYICLDGETSSKTYVDEYLLKHGVILKPEFKLATSDMLVSFAKRGFGIAGVVKEFAKEELKKGELFEIAFPETIQPREFAIIYDERQIMSLAAKRLLDQMVKKNDIS